MATQAHPEPITLTEEQLTAAVCSYYSQLRSDNLPILTQHIPAEFVRIQKQIIEVVELRKNMERVLEVQALQAQHFPTVQHLLQANKKQEQIIAEMAAHIKSLESSKMEAFTDALIQNRQERISDGSEIIQKGQQIVLQLNDFKRTFTITPPNLPQLAIKDSLQTEPEGLAWQHEQHFAQLMRWQQRRWQLAKFIYSVKLKELNLRDQLLEERERAQVDFERANHQLIDTLLREKERDKNLRKKDKETFGEIIKQRDQIDLENENLSHSQKSLLPHLQNELLRLKKRLKQQEEKHRIQQQRWQKKNEELAKEMQHINALCKAQETDHLEKEANLRQKLNELQLQLESSSENRRVAEGSLKASRAQASLQLQRIKSRLKQLQHQNSQLMVKNDHLQSQYSELILKSSQLNQIKGDLAQKFDKAAKRAQQVEGKLEELKANLDTKDQELRSMQSTLQTLKSEKEHYQGVIGQLEGALEEQKNYVRHYQDKTTIMESQLTQNFILHNEQRANLLIELDQKTNAIQQLKSLLQDQKETRATMPAPSSNELSPTMLATIKEEVLAELARNEKIKLQLIDSFVGRIQNLV